MAYTTPRITARNTRAGRIFGARPTAACKGRGQFAALALKSLGTRFTQLRSERLTANTLWRESLRESGYDSRDAPQQTIFAKQNPTTAQRSCVASLQLLSRHVVSVMRLLSLILYNAA